MWRSASPTRGGIAPENLKKIFDPYFTIKQQCTGLGLATTYAVISQPGGHITVDSEVGRRTTFHLLLPALEGGVAREEKPAETRSLTGHGRILVMDDDILVREVVGKMLRKLGYEPVFAQEGKEALKLYAQSRDRGLHFAAVILDLPVPGGMAAWKRSSIFWPRTPRPGLWSRAAMSTIPSWPINRRYGFRGDIAKPYKISGLSEVLQKVLVAPAA